MSKRYNKADLIHLVTVLINDSRDPSQYVSQKTVTNVLNGIIQAITNVVADGDIVTLVGFGRFESWTRTQRKFRNPKTGEPLTIPEAVLPKFSPGKLFKDAVEQSVEIEDQEVA